MSLDQKLKYLRTENNMTQRYVAKRLNVARSTIAGYETKSRQPSHEKLTALAELFNVSIDYLLSDTNTIETMPNNSSKLLKDELALLRLYRSLSERSKKELLSQGHLLTLRDREDRIIRKR